MDWHTLLTRERLGKPLHSPEELGRSPFHKDHDRIIFSGAFRRLGRKTQVHPVSSNDHIHTRLTHSLEVSCVGRSLGMRVGETIRNALPDWCEPSDLGMVVQSACLAHDIGNPPFGHSGEDAIRHWFQQAAARGWLDAMSEAERNDFLNFEGNAQGFRVLTQPGVSPVRRRYPTDLCNAGHVPEVSMDGQARRLAGLQETQVRLLSERVAATGADRP
ncbi:dGTP triphosphohydrolase [Pseudomonas baetica]|nr:dGTP triphosphohydrolase [Pseudomonas baetica]